MFRGYLTARQFSYFIAFKFLRWPNAGEGYHMDHRPSKTTKRGFSGCGSGARLSPLDRLGQACACMLALLMLGAVAWLGATGCGDSGGNSAAAATPTATESTSSPFTSALVKLMHFAPSPAVSCWTASPTASAA